MTRAAGDAQSDHIFETLNALRGVAAMLVVLFHAAPLIGGVAPGGYLAVDLFFILSGFVIAHRYDRRLRSGFSWRGVLLARLIRFWPLLALSILLCAAKAVLAVIVFPGSALPLSEAAIILGATFLLLPYPSFGDLFPLNVPLWTLALEFYVSIAYAVLFPWLGPRVLWAGVVASGLCLAICVVGFGDNNIGTHVATALGGVARAVFGFLVGVGLCRSGIRWPLGPFVPVVALIVLACLPLAPDQRAGFDLAFVFVLAPLIVISGASAEPWGRFAAMAQYLGSLSFALYIVHSPIITGVDTLSQAFGLNAFALGLATLIALLVFSSMIVRFYDAPLRAYLRRQLAYSGVRWVESKITQ
ncbi:MAG: acyltransferase [Devosia sp.]|nr:acyltransferase [Devosia sp.]